MERIIKQVLPVKMVIDDGDMRLIRALPQTDHPALGPFVFVDHYRHQSRRGIGDRPHPHAGIEVVSYLLEGSVEHRDSMGHVDRLAAGDAQFIRAGRGMIHAEQPLEGRHGLQLWVSLPPAMKQVEPSYTSIRSSDIPNAIDESGGSQVYVIAGFVNGMQGPMALSGGAVFARIRLQPGSTVALDFDPSLELGIYVLQGTVAVGNSSLATGSLGILSDGEMIKLKAGDDEVVEVALIGGEPIKGAVLFHGPFVMDTREKLLQAQEDFATGKMGTLDGVPF